MEKVAAEIPVIKAFYPNLAVSEFKVCVKNTIKKPYEELIY